MSIKPYFESKHCTLYHGDCLEIMPELAAGSVDAILCDLPYGTTNCSWDTVIPFEPLWECYKAATKKNAAIVLFGSEPFSSALRMSNIKEYKYDWIWLKSTGAGFIHAKNMPLKRTENLSVFSMAGMGHRSILKEARMNYNPQGLIKVDKTHKRPQTGCVNVIGKRPSHKREFKVEFANYPKNILEFKQGNNNNIHPTQKPVALMEYMIRTYTHEGETVMDNCFGSGTTGVACCKTNRQFIGIEKEEKYCEIAAKRIERAEIDAAQNLFLEPEPVIPEKQMELTI